MEYTVPDTLVLKIVEYEVKTDKKDNIIYILFDTSLNKFIIRGKRVPLDSCTYSFECDNSSKLFDFIDFLIDRYNKVSYILYNYDNLPKSSNDITYEFLESYYDVRYEISGYDNKTIRKKELVKNLNMLKNVNNKF